MVYGHATTMLHNGKSTEYFTVDYTGTQSNNSANYNSTNVEYPVLDKPIIEADIQAFFPEAVAAVNRHRMTLCLAHIKKQSTIILLDDTRLTKPQEYVLLTLEDNHNPNETRALIGIYPHVAPNLLPQIRSTKDWLLTRRKLKKTIPKGKYPVVFAPGIGGILMHEIVGHPFELHRPYAQHSPANLNKGHQLFSSNLSVKDVPLSLVCKEDFDDEGTPTKETVLLQNGIVGMPLTDSRTCLQFPEYPLTGNCRRESCNHKPTPRMYCTYVEDGTDSASQAIGGIEYGFYAEAVSYAIVDHLANTIVMSVGKGRIIRHGTLTDAPVVFTIADKMSAFTNVKHVCNDGLLLPGICGGSSGMLYVEHGSPTMAFGGVQVVNASQGFAQTH